MNGFSFFWTDAAELRAPMHANGKAVVRQSATVVIRRSISAAPPSSNFMRQLTEKSGDGVEPDLSQK
jgi:predicted nuclease with RNAse H fold